ncbi:MAG: Uma2 family endonuclease [Trueperaceae bacterium]
MMRTLPPVKTGLSFEDYLDFEATATEKHEFIDGQLFMMAGATERHNRITGRFYALLLAAEDGTCKTYFADMKLRTPNDTGYYPDVLVVCDEEDNHPLVKRKPCLIIEVLSESTEAIDRGEKLGNYRLFESLQAYVLVNQHANRLEVYRHQDEGFWRYEVYENDDKVKLPCVNLELGVRQIYQGL